MIKNITQIHHKMANTIECGFCSWKGTKYDLEKNGHCPKCQSPSTKNKSHGHIRKTETDT